MTKDMFSMYAGDPNAIAIAQTFYIELTENLLTYGYTT